MAAAAWQVAAHVNLTVRGVHVDSIESQPSIAYNCIAWAVEETHRRWWPTPNPGWHWPIPIAGETLPEFIAAFRTRGYEPCTTGNPELNFKKIAIYVDHTGLVKHAARQLPNGQWTSKLGKSVDVFHSLVQLEGAHCPALGYGSVAQFMRCPIAAPAAVPTPPG